ncbi:MAG: DNA topoisomerase IB [Verrucomicrobiota bacterium]|nr:DNA topoisomerase IB [Verrucomicrobiota bacterium]
MPAATARPDKPTKETPVADAVAISTEEAEGAGLRYVTDEQPGYTRKAKGDGFEYFDTSGKLIEDESRVLRINRLAVPPAYKDVWICPSPNGHLQATGRDARGRKQYRYHERWREARDETKYGRMLPFAAALPKIRRRIEADLGLPGLPRNKVLATVLSIMQRTFIRIGNEEYARDNKSFGLTTMRNRHVDVKGTKLRFTFKGKSGVSHELDVDDRRLARIVRKMEDLPGQEIFAYVDEEGAARDVKSQDVNDYLREISGDDFTAKDFRTWAGTVLAAVALHAHEQAETEAAAKKNVKAAITAVSKILGNTPAICRKCYVHPAVLEAYITGSPIEGLKQRMEGQIEEKLNYLRSEEAAVMSFLQAKLADGE